MSRSISTKLAVAMLAGCVSVAVWADPDKDESGHGRHDHRSIEHHSIELEYHADRRGDSRGSYFHDHGYERLDIPAGHYPPPGECRVWYPDRPAGHQPPPGPCGRLESRVPRGAWLMRHPGDDEEHVHIVVYDDYRPGSIRAVGEFDIGSGAFVRVVLDR